MPRRRAVRALASGADRNRTLDIGPDGCRPDPSLAARAAVAAAQGLLRSSAEEGQDDRDAAPITKVFVAEMRDQISLLEEDPDEDVSRGRDCEQQVPLGHTRCGPDRQDKAQV